MTSVEFRSSLTKDVDVAMASSLLNIYFSYSLVIGITSHRLINKQFRSSTFSRYYALIVNILVATLLPLVMWDAQKVFQTKRQFPQLILITCRVRYLVTYIVIMYTVVSRGFRDTAFREMGPLLLKLIEMEKRYGHRGISRSLRLLMYTKYITLTWLCLTDSLFLFYSVEAVSAMMIVKFIFLTNANNVLLMVPMGYFMALWHIARGFNCINQRLNDIIASSAPSPRHLKELLHLWSLHSALTKTALNINKIYGPQMLASRFDNFVISVIQAYWGAFFTFGLATPVFWLVYGSLNYTIRSVDYYLIDHMCDVVVEYQSSARDAWSEKRWAKETSAFVTYANSSKLQLWTCGLYQPNRSLWCDMIINVLYYILVLLQFHLVMGKLSK